MITYTYDIFIYDIDISFVDLCLILNDIKKKENIEEYKLLSLDKVFRTILCRNDLCSQWEKCVCVCDLVDIWLSTHTHGQSDYDSNKSTANVI